jgi:hypothetical protein
VVGEALALNRDELIEGCNRDAHPAREIHLWETLGVAFMEARQRRPMTRAQRAQSLGAFVRASMRPSTDDARRHTSPPWHPIRGRSGSTSSPKRRSSRSSWSRSTANEREPGQPHNLASNALAKSRRPEVSPAHHPASTIPATLSGLPHH